MKIASVHEIKQELGGLSHAKLVTLCTLLARNKKENKEFISYWLFDAGDQDAYIESVKTEITRLMAEVHPTNMWAAKKTIRKILRLTNKYIRFTGSPLAETELLMHFCDALQKSGVQFRESTALLNLYHQQIKKIRKALTRLHEDLQHDYGRKLDVLI